MSSDRSQFYKLMNNEAENEPCYSNGTNQVEMEVPSWFNEELFIRGRKYIIQNLTAQMTASLNGLICVLSIPSSIKILVMTEKSSTTFSAYKRYLSTIMHLNSWIRSDLRPGTDAWKSLQSVRKRHLAASKRANLKNLGRITQKDLVITLFGFFGYGFLKPEMLGFYTKNQQDVKAFLHFWRTIGFMVGIRDEYNFCSGSIEDVREKAIYICDTFCKPNIKNPPEHFFHMVTAMLSGMFYIAPLIRVRPFLFYAYRLNDISGFQYKSEQVKNSGNSITNNKSSHRNLESKENCITSICDNNNSNCLLDGKILFESMSAIDKHFLFGMRYIFEICLFRPISRKIINFYFYLIFLLLPYLPIGALIKFRTKKVFVDMFSEDTTVPTTMATNREVLNDLYKDKEIFY